MAATTNLNRNTVSLSPGGGFWTVALAFMLVMAVGALPTPLCVLYERRDRFSGLIVTIIFAVYALGVVASLFLAGHSSDWFGRRRVLVSAVLLNALSAGVFAVWPALPGLLVARVLTGLSVGAMTATATAYLAELHASRGSGASGRRAELVATGANLGGIGIGPLIAGLLAQISSGSTDPALRDLWGDSARARASRVARARDRGDAGPPALPPAAHLAAGGRSSPFLYRRRRRVDCVCRVRAVYLAGSELPRRHAWLSLTRARRSRRFCGVCLRCSGPIRAGSCGCSSPIGHGHRAAPRGTGSRDHGHLDSQFDRVSRRRGAVRSRRRFARKGRIDTVLELAPREARAAILAGFFLAAHLGLSGPIVGLGLATQYVSERVSLLGFVGVLALALVAMASTLVGSPERRGRPRRDPEIIYQGARS